MESLRLTNNSMKLPMNVLITFLLLNLFLISSVFSQDQSFDEEFNCDQLIELSFEVDQGEDPLTFYAYPPGIDNPIAMVRDHNGNGRFEESEVFYFTKDHLG